MKKIALIPARLNSSRLPKKLLLPLQEKPIIWHTYNRVFSSKLFDKVYVVTNSKEIKEELEKYDTNVIYIDKEFETGTDRIADAYLTLNDKNVEIVVNVQGDEPFINMEPIGEILKTFELDKDKEIDLMSMMVPLKNKDEISNPNNVKVIVDSNDYALYFSRAAIPFDRDSLGASYLKHVGVYAFRVSALFDFTKTEIAPLEKVEKIEAIRFLEMGKKIKMIKITETGLQIDTLEDYQDALKLTN